MVAADPDDAASVAWVPHHAFHPVVMLDNPGTFAEVGAPLRGELRAVVVSAALVVQGCLEFAHGRSGSFSIAARSWVLMPLFVRMGQNTDPPRYAGDLWSRASARSRWAGERELSSHPTMILSTSSPLT